LGTYSVSVQSGSFKSIKKPLEWPEIPPLAVLTGLNGSGKSQLLRAIAMNYDDHLRAQFGKLELDLKIEGISLKPHEVLFIDDFARPLDSSRSSVANLEQRISEYRGSSSYQNVHEQHIASLLRNKIIRLRMPTCMRHSITTQSC
jgi:recombinational DNA repair ATPase RecF